MPMMSFAIAAVRSRREIWTPRLCTGLTRILVTGVTGQVGALRTRSKAVGSVIAAGRNLFNNSSTLDRIAPDLSTRRPVLGLGWTVPSSPRSLMARQADPWVIAPLTVDRAEDEKELTFWVNGETPGVIVRWAAGVLLIHFSTDYASQTLRATFADNRRQL
jgi:dTDP-4-dehydrorhamnose reductase